MSVKALTCMLRKARPSIPTRSNHRAQLKQRLREGLSAGSGPANQAEAWTFVQYAQAFSLVLILLLALTQGQPDQTSVAAPQSQPYASLQELLPSGAFPPPEASSAWRSAFLSVPLGQILAPVQAPRGESIASLLQERADFTALN
ncbi:hypothetical protein JXA32_12705 [Candidatus Sumerlaeota bacterium]|nr:hypothetical protein [Candidatus Sumerlaeota bacterium]